MPSWDGDDLVLLVRVQPRSRRNELIDVQQERLRRLKRDSAADLGALPDQSSAVTDRISVPRWRLPKIYIPHPSLTQGRYLLDTPGLHGLDTESELADELLSEAHAIMFPIGAEAGVTQSDVRI